MTVGHAVIHDPGITSSVLKLLRLRLAILISGIRRAKMGAKLGYLAIGVVGIATVGIILFFSVAALNLLNSPQLAQNVGNAMQFLESIPVLILTFAALGITITSFSVLLQVLYLSGDMDFLMSAPVPVRAVFVAKLIQAVLPNFTILCVVSLPVMFGLGISSGYNLLYYPLVILVLALISLVAASLASLLVLAVVRFFPARRVAEVLGFVVGITFFILAQSGRFTGFSFENIGERQIADLLSITERFNHPLSPFTWAGRGLAELGKGEWLISLGLLSAYMVFAGLIFIIALAASERTYYTGWAGLKSSRRSPKSKAKSVPPAAGATEKSRKILNPLNRLISAPVRAVLVKDVRLYRRDLASLSSLLFPMILGVVYAVGLLRSGGKMPVGRGEAPPGFIEAGAAVFGYFDIALALFLGGLLVNNLAGFSFSREGKNFWLLKKAPINTNQLITAKFLVGYVPTVLVCSIYLLILNVLKQTPPLVIFFNLVSIGIILAGMNGISLALGIQGAKFDWENPSQIHRTMGCMGQLLGLLFMLVCFMLFVTPLFLARLLEWPAVAGQIAGMMLCAIASTLAVIIPIGLVYNRIPILNE